MKTKNLVTTALFIFSLLLFASLTADAYNGRNGGGNKTNQRCLSYLSGLTADQISSITALNTEHQLTMDKLREERRSTTDAKAKAEIRAKMLDQQSKHRGEVKKLLTPEQQAVYESQVKAGSRSAVNQSSGRGNGERGNGCHNHSCRY